MDKTVLTVLCCIVIYSRCFVRGQTDLNGMEALAEIINETCSGIDVKCEENRNDIEKLKEDIGTMKVKVNTLVDEINGAIGGLATRDLQYIDHTINDLKNRFKMILNTKATIADVYKVGQLKIETKVETEAETQKQAVIQNETGIGAENEKDNTVDIDRKTVTKPTHFRIG